MKLKVILRQNNPNSVARFISFGLAGVAVDYSCFMGLRLLGADPVIARVVAYFLAISFTAKFISRFVFKVSATQKQRLQTVVLYLLTGALNVLVFTQMIALEMNHNFAFFLATTLAACVNYFAVRALSLGKTG